MSADNEIDRLAEVAESDLLAVIMPIYENALAAIDAQTIEAVLNNFEDAEHTTAQLSAALGFYNDDFEPLRDLILDEDSPTSAIGGLAELFAGVAILAAAMFGSAFLDNHALFRAGRTEYARDAIRRLYADDSMFMRDAIERAVTSSGTTTAIARQLRRSVGLTTTQAKQLDTMRRFLHDEIAAGTTRLTGQARLDAVSARVQRLRGHVTAPQRQLVFAALTNPGKFTPDHADALLDRHATALRKHRMKVAAAMHTHTATEGGKLIGWQIAEALGAVPVGTKRFWRTAADERVRHAHAQVLRMNPAGVALNEPFDTPLGFAMIPPLEINCRCRVYVRKPQV